MFQRTSMGHHTFTVSQRLTIDEAKELYQAFQSYEDVTVIPSHGNKVPPGADGFVRSLYAASPKYYTVVYPDELKGIKWNLRLSYHSPGFIRQSDDDDKPCSVKATINPKLFTGITDYVAAASECYLRDVETAFNREAASISPVLGTFERYILNRADYCVNFDLGELGIDCPPELMMKLIERGDIPPHFTERTEFDEISRRYKPMDHCFYLTNNAVNINCYWKHFQLINKFSDCPNIDDALNVIRFEIQCKYPKIKVMEKDHFGFSGAALIHEMLSDEVCNTVITSYFNRVIRLGDYFPLETARRRVQSLRFHPKKEARLIGDLTLINRCRGIAKAKATLQDDEAREDFRRSLRELEAMNINPVTIPKEWNIKHIPNLLGAYRRKVEMESANREIVEDYYDEKCRKEKKRKNRAS